MDWRAFRRVRAGEKLKRDSLTGEGLEKADWGTVAVREREEPVWWVVIERALGSEKDSGSAMVEREIAPWERTRRAVMLRDVSRKT